MKHEEQYCNYEQALTSVDLEVLLRKLERLSFIVPRRSSHSSTSNHWHEQTHKCFKVEIVAVPPPSIDISTHTGLKVEVVAVPVIVPRRSSH